MGSPNSNEFEFPFGKKHNRPEHQIAVPIHAESKSTDGKEGKNVLLFTPIDIGGAHLKNRIVVSPISNEGYFNDWHLVHLGGLARGGSALVFTEATSVAPEGRLSPWDAGLWEDGQIEMLHRIVSFIHSQGSLAGIQLAHGGRKASMVPPFFNPPDKKVPPTEGGWDVVGPSTEPWDSSFPTPREVTKEEIQEIIQKFVDAARRAKAAKMDVIEIHAAHGYLLSSFHSPATNHRTDEYGGSFENRIRFSLEIVRAVRKEWKGSLWFRVSSTDWLPEGTGWDLSQTLLLAERLKDEGVDLIDCSSAGNHPQQKIPNDPNYQIQFAKEVKQKVKGIAVGAVGRITEAIQAETILQENSADVLLIARALLDDPHWPLHAAEKLGGIESFVST